MRNLDICFLFASIARSDSAGRVEQNVLSGLRGSHRFCAHIIIQVPFCLATTSCMAQCVNQQ